MESQSTGASERASVREVGMKLEVVVVSVSDVDRAKEFYGTLGWRLDADRVAEDFRLIQFTPPGSGCSIQFGSNITSAQPGSAQGLLLIVSDIEAARDELVSRGVKVSEVFHCATGFMCRVRDGDGSFQRVSGLAPDHLSYGSYVSFSDPDGNGWVFQEVTSRLPGRLDPGLSSFAAAGDLASALRRAAAAHGEHERRIGQADANWPDWYAEYMVAEQAGAELPTLSPDRRCAPIRTWGSGGSTHVPLALVTSRSRRRAASARSAPGGGRRLDKLGHRPDRQARFIMVRGTFSSAAATARSWRQRSLLSTAAAQPPPLS